MRKKYDFSNGIRRPASRASGQKSRRGSPDHGIGLDQPDDWLLTPAQIREIDRRVADLDDPVRYLLVSRMGPHFSLYYNVSDDVYAMNNPGAGTLFKRRKVAESIKQALGRRVQIVECRTRQRKGARVPVLSSLDKRPNGR
jgi:hypothetical protein